LKTIPELFSAAAEKAPNAKIHFPNDGIMTYEEIELETRKAATGLAKLGVGPGDRVGFWLPNLRAYLGLLGACGQLGAIAVAMNTRFRKAEIEDVLGRVQPKVMAFVPGVGRWNHIDILLQVEPSLLSCLSAVVQCEGEQLCSLDQVNNYSYASIINNPPIKISRAKPEASFCIFNTSGTTSLPKFVLHNQERVVRHAEDVVNILAMEQPKTMVLQSLPFCGVFGFIFLLSSIRAGASFVMPPIFEAHESAKYTLSFDVTHIAGGDDMFSRLLEEGIKLTNNRPVPFPTLRFCPYASFNSALADFPVVAYRRGLPLVGPFGMSEVFSFFSMRRMNDPETLRTVGGGFPANSTAKIRARDPDTGVLLPHGREGELEVWSPNIFVGYYGNEEATQAAFTKDGFLKTGDLGSTCEDGSFTYLGRMGDVLRLGGFLVNPLEIEMHLCSHEQVKDAQVVAVATKRGMRPVAFILAEHSKGKFSENLLIEYCKDALAGFKIPIRILEIDAFPTTPSPNGTKIQKGALRKLAIETI